MFRKTMNLETIEQYAHTLLSSPYQVSTEARDQATHFFEDLKKNISLKDALTLLAETKNAFVMFQMGQAVGEIVLRDWSLIEANDVQFAYKTILEFVATSPSIESYVVGACLKSAAMIIKRGILDEKSGDQEQLYQFIHQMLTNESAKIQAAGCLFISALIEQFSSAWRNSKFSITWDFHLQAKSRFENNGLRRLLEMSLTTLHALSNQDDIVGNNFTHRLCDRFLEVSENILSWNFSSRLYRRFLSNNQSSTSFRPPISWKDLLENDEFFTLFFKLHAKIRHDETLCTKSMNCLIQLASLTGDCMPVSDQEASVKYIRTYISNYLELFAAGPTPCETNHFCMIINRLFLYRPLTSLMRQEAGLRTRFFLFLKDYTIHLTNQAMQKAIAQAEHDDHTSLALIYDAYVVLLKGRWMAGFNSNEDLEAVDKELVKWPILMIVNAFITNVLAPPQGTRPIAKDEDENDEDSEDRTLFADLFNPLSSMICYSIPEFLDVMTVNLRNALTQFTNMATGASDTSRLPVWQEDQHWIMLILAHSVVGEEVDGACHVSGDVFDHTQKLFHGGRRFCPQKKAQYLQMCMEAPTQDRTPFAQEVDPFIILMGELFAWAAIEHEVFSNASREMISPELCRSTFLCLRRFLNAVSSPVDCEKWDDFQGVSSEAMPIMPKDKEFSAILVRFVIKKVLAILVNYGAEEKLCQDAIDCLLGLVESHASDIASSPELFEYLNSLDIARLPNRGNLMKALVLIGAAANDVELQENMFKLILVPLSERFTAVADAPSRTDVDSQLVDYLQCFDGVARASQSHSATVLFKFLEPIIAKCIPLMQSRSQNETVVSNILQLILHVTTKVSIYIENEDSSNMLYSSLLQIVDCYRNDQIKQFSTFTEDDEEKAADLTMFLDILSNVLSKDFLTLGEEHCSTGAKVVIHSLEMLLTIMNDRVLQMPDVALKFFRLILYLVEFSPESLTEISDSLMSSLCQCISLGMTGQFGMEITSTSLESLTEVVLYYGLQANKPRCTQSLAFLFKQMLPTVFETCLENTCENSIYAESCSALYAIIAFERSFFDEYVNELLSKKSNEAARSVLQAAFVELMAVAPESGNRRGRVQFRSRMEAFLNKIQGLLSYC